MFPCMCWTGGGFNQLRVSVLAWFCFVCVACHSVVVALENITGRRCGINLRLPSNRCGSGNSLKIWGNCRDCTFHFLLMRTLKWREIYLLYNSPLIQLRIRRMPRDRREFSFMALNCGVGRSTHPIVANTRPFAARATASKATLGRYVRHHVDSSRRHAKPLRGKEALAAQGKRARQPRLPAGRNLPPCHTREACASITSVHSSEGKQSRPSRTIYTGAAAVEAHINRDLESHNREKRFPRPTSALEQDPVLAHTHTHTHTQATTTQPCR